MQCQTVSAPSAHWQRLTSLSHVNSGREELGLFPYSALVTREVYKCCVTRIFREFLAFALAPMIMEETVLVTFAYYSCGHVWRAQIKFKMYTMATLSNTIILVPTASSHPLAFICIGIRIWTPPVPRSLDSSSSRWYEIQHTDSVDFHPILL